MNLKEAIIGYITKFRVLDQIVLIDALEISYPSASNADKLTALSELVQDNTIRRYEYKVDGRPERRSFYMSADTKVCL